MALRSQGGLAVLSLTLHTCRQKPENEVSKQRAVLSASVTICSELTQAEMYWQSLLLPGGGWENLPVRALELS